VGLDHGIGHFMLVEVDSAAANKHKQKIVDQLHKGIQFLMKENGVEVITGSVAFE